MADLKKYNDSFEDHTSAKEGFREIKDPYRLMQLRDEFRTNRDRYAQLAAKSPADSRTHQAYRNLSSHWNQKVGLLEKRLAEIIGQVE